MKNLGPKSTEWLKEIGICTLDDLAAVGSVTAYRVLKDRNPNVTLNMLYALEGALTNRRWNELTAKERAHLRREAENEVKVRIVRRG